MRPRPWLKHLRSYVHFNADNPTTDVALLLKHHSLQPYCYNATVIRRKRIATINAAKPSNAKQTRDKPPTIDPMTALVARQPLHPLSMSSSQSRPKRLSARLQQKDDGQNEAPTKSSNKVSADSTKAQATTSTDTKKRKHEYDEEDDGFAFSRVRKKKSRVSTTKTKVPSEVQQIEEHVQEPQETEKATAVPVTNGDSTDHSKKRRNKMSFSTPNPKEVQPVRRSKRLSNEHAAAPVSPVPKQRPRDTSKKETTETRKDKTRSDERVTTTALASEPSTSDENHSGTKIALPFADTPVIRRNKAMREGKSGNGERRSSLGFRGRRASSLIETGNSNALPHNEVEVSDFYKHIESDGLPEPRRMRQLLTWCATRCLDQKPIGTDFEDASARSAARVIEEELLKDLGNKSDLSDWFAREDVPIQPKQIPERPNPKNIQNTEKIVELEEQIKRLRAEKEALESLLRPPAIPQTQLLNTSDPLRFDTSLLSESDAQIIKSLNTGMDLSSTVSNRLNSLRSSLGPTTDSFADGVHKIGQYRAAADNVASRILAICSEKLAQRENESRKQALSQERDTSPRRDVSSVLRGLSRVDR